METSLVRILYGELARLEVVNAHRPSPVSASHISPCQHQLTPDYVPGSGPRPRNPKW